MSSGPTPPPPPPPSPAPSPTPADRSNRRTLIAVVTGAVLGLAVIGVVAFLLNSSDNDEDVSAPGATASSEQPPTSTAQPTPPTTEPATPTGTSSPELSGDIVQLPAGVSVLVPPGWESDFVEGGREVFLSDDFGNSVLVLAGEGEKGGDLDALPALVGFQTAFLSPAAGYSEVQVTGPEQKDAVSPVSSYAQLSFTAKWTDTQGEVFPREGRMDSQVRQDGGGLLIMVESKGGALSANQARWGPIVDSAMESFAGSA